MHQITHMCYFKLYGLKRGGSEHCSSLSIVPHWWKKQNFLDPFSYLASFVPLACRQRWRLNTFSFYFWHSSVPVLLLENRPGDCGRWDGDIPVHGALLLLDSVPRHLCEDDICTLLDAGTALECPRAGTGPATLHNVWENLPSQDLLPTPPVGQ